MSDFGRDVDQSPSMTSSAPDSQPVGDAPPDSERSKRILRLETADSAAVRLREQNERSKEESVRHLRWQDNASMTIRELKEQVEFCKHEQRAAKKAALRETVERQRKLADLDRQIQNSELEKVRLSEEQARATSAHEERLQEARNELEAQKEAARQAAVAAEDHLREVQVEHAAEMTTARSKIQELRAAYGFTFTGRREADEIREELAEAKREKIEESTAKEEEIKTLRDGIKDRDTQIRRLRDEARTSRQANEEATRERTRLHRAKMDADGKVDRLRTKNEDLRSKGEEVDSRASAAEGRAKGIQDQLAVANKRAEHWQTMYTNAMEDARDSVLSAYAVTSPQNTTEQEDDSPRSTKTASDVQALSDSVEELRKENAALREQMVGLKKEWRDAWDKAAQEQKTWQQTILRECDEEKREAFDKARANDLAASERDAREGGIRRQCEEEKRTALAAERESCRGQWEGRESSLRSQFALKLKTRDDQERRKLRRKSGAEPKRLAKVEKRHLKRVLGTAVSRAVEMERGLIERKLRSECQRQLSSQKTRFESELAKSKSRSEEEEVQKKAGPSSTDPMLRDEEIRKRDECIATIKGRLKTAYDEKRTAENDLEDIREENERLSRDVSTRRSQESMTRQVGTEAQTALMASDFARALKLLDEVAVMGLDDQHRAILSELLLANKTVREMRCSIEEEGERVDHDDMKNRLDRIVAASDSVEDPDPAAHPTLHAQLAETYSLVGALLHILSGPPRGEATNADLLGRIYGDWSKGKGKQGAVSHAANTTLFPSAPADDTLLLPLYQSGFGTDAATMPPLDNAAAAAQDGAEDMDSATAHALQGMDEIDPDALDLSSIDWSDPAWLNFLQSG